MNIAVDTNCILPGKVGGIEDYTVALIEALCLPGTPAKKVFILARPENREMFSALFGGRCELLTIPRPLYRGEPVRNWAELMRQSPRRSARVAIGVHAGQESSAG